MQKLSSIIVFLFLLLFLTTGLLAQSEDYEPKTKARKSFNAALDMWRSNEPEKAEKELRKAISIDSLYARAYILLGDVCMDMKRPDEAIIHYRKASTLNPERPQGLLYLLGIAYLENEEYAASAENLRAFISTPRIRSDQKENAEGLLRLAEFRKHALENPVPFQPENLGPFVNSKDDEFVNSITLNEQQLVYTLMKPDSIIKGHFTEGFEMAVKTDSGWYRTGRALPALHELGNIGAMSLSPDGRFLFFTSCGAPDGHGSCDLYVCGKEGDDKWSDPQNLGGIVNSSGWDSQPCFSADGQSLYFSSARGGGYGGSDIWSSKFIQGQGWTRPVNAGKNINSGEEEMAPFIHPDGRTIYFSSKGHAGMGGFDLYISRLDSNNHWTSPLNLGWPVNTQSDEINIVVSTNGKAAYLSSDLEEGHGGYDIYRFDLPAELRPYKVGYLEGNVYDADTKKALKAGLELTDLESGEVTVRCESEPSGHYIAALPGGRNYALNISKQGYMFYSENFNLEVSEMKGESVQKDIYLQPIKSGQSITLNNIFFETNEYALDELSLVELYRINAFLVQNPGIRIMICGHTDDVGTEEYNQVLSENRARSVYSFLIEVGIEAKRLEYKGFGKSEPISDNETEEGRALNRRTEMLVL